MNNITTSHFGSVELVSYCGDDLSVVNAARVSFSKHSDAYTLDDAKLLRFLMRERHGTPFEHNYFKFHVQAPIVVFWEWVRHRIASYNVESGRYTEMKPYFYIPKSARIQKGKPGQYHFAFLPEETEWLQENLSHFSELGYYYYCEALDRGIAKEQARLFLPMNLYVQFFFSCNARSLMNFLSLRNSTTAMKEIRDYAEVIEDLWSKKMPDTAAAFREFKRVAP